MATFLIIDDSMVMRTVLRYLLERCGATVLAEAKDAEEAIALLRQHKPEALTLAASLRGEAGAAVLAALRRGSWAGKVFFTASDEQAAEEKAARESGADGVLRKPFTLEQVRGELIRVMGG